MFIAGYQFNTFSVINYDYVLLKFDKLKINLILIYAINLISSINLLLYSGIHSVWYFFYMIFKMIHFDSNNCHFIDHSF